MSERNSFCVEAKAGGLGERHAACGPRQPAAIGAAIALTAFLMTPDARAASKNREIALASPSASAEHTLIHVGPLALKMRTSSIVLGAADGASAGDGAIFAPNTLAFAAARESGVFSVAGSARAALTLNFDVSDFLTDMNGRLPLPMGGVGRQLQAALALEPGGKLSVDVGSTFGLSSSSKSAPDPVGGHFSFSMNALKPWKRVGVRWRFTFY